jgi:hypothetical protein
LGSKALYVVGALDFMDWQAVEGGGVGVWIVRNPHPRKSDHRKIFLSESSSLTG